MIWTLENPGGCSQRLQERAHRNTLGQLGQISRRRGPVVSGGYLCS
jgi:hypothetical protein